MQVCFDVAMDIEKLARKLEPLVPEQVEHLRRVRDIADVDIEKPIETHFDSVVRAVVKPKPAFPR